MGRKGTNELISGEKPFIAILSNLKCLFTRLEARVVTASIHTGVIVSLGTREETAG